MLDRIAAEPLERLASQFPVVGITGPRQSGKTTLARMVFPNKAFISFDEKSMREIAASNPDDFLMAFPNGAIIDEAQKVPEIFDAIKLNVDRDKYNFGKYILTGSSQFKLRQNISDSLAGRAAYLRLMPFSIGELKKAGCLSDNAYQTIFKGQYPPLYDEHNSFSSQIWYENYLDTYLEMDVADQITPSNLSLFRKFIQVCALYSGQLLSMEGISREIGVSANTIRSWLSILENSYIIHLLEPDTMNLGKNLVKTPKLYFIDSGLLCHLLRMRQMEDILLDRRKGAIVETFAISELMKHKYNKGEKPDLTFFRDHKGFEVDTIANWAHSFAIEIKSDSKAEKKMSGNLRKYLALRNDASIEGTILYLGDYSFNIDGIHYQSWKDWDKLEQIQ